MSKKVLAFCLSLGSAGFYAYSAPTEAIAEAPAINWVRTLTPETFVQAKTQQRLVILDLEAVWCHWCHVMDQETYSSDAVRKIVSDKYIAVRIDQDARPDLGNRFRDFGWPATIIFGSDGEELEKLAGFVPPEEMEKLLKELAENPKSRVPQRKIVFSEESSLSSELRDGLKQRFESGLDRRQGGLNTSHKYLDSDTLEYAISRAAKNDTAMALYVRTSLLSNFKLIDPVWGGVYQYSTRGDWDHPHFEKIATKQSETIRLYALAYAYTKDAAYKGVIDSTRSYLKSFLLGPDGGYYTSQDADVKKGEHSEAYFKLGDLDRRKQGIPTIDTHAYASENGRLISAYTEAYGATTDISYLKDALQIAGWAKAHRTLGNGGFSHGAADPAGPYLCDSLNMGQAFLGLYAVTGDRGWLADAELAASFIAANFQPAPGEAGFLTSKVGAGVFHPLPILPENVRAVRFLASLANYTGKPEYKKLAGIGMRYLATEDIATDSLTEIGVVIADTELNQEPTHITIVGGKRDPVAFTLFAAALRYPANFKRSEWWDRKEGAMPNPDVQYPPLPKAAAFVCTNRRCSLPIFKPEDLAPTVEKMLAQSSS